MRSLLLAALSCTLVVGCPGGDDGDDVDAATGVPLAEAADRYGRVYCERLLDCSALGIALLSQTTCELAAWTYRNDTLADLGGWVAAGTVRYDPVAMAGCLEDVASLACPALSSASLADHGRCGAALAGQVTTGGACDDSLECQAGLYCDTAAGCPGTCQPRVAATAACTDDAQCGPGLDCAGGTCQAFGQDGASCGPSAQAGCALGFQCDTGGGTPGVCRPLSFAAGDGQRCAPGAGTLCAAGLVCAMVEDAPASYQCQPPAPAGGACFRAVPSACPAGEVCVVPAGDDAGTCTAQGTLGQPCLTGAGVLFGCAAGLACDGTTSTCVALRDNGQACTAAAQCANGCEAGVCAGPPACD